MLKGFGKETGKNPLENVKSDRDAVLNKLEDIKNGNFEQLKAKMMENLSSKNEIENKETNENVKEGLTDEEKKKIKEESGWSDEIVNYIGSMEQYRILQKLKEAVINGKRCLIRSDIDMNQKDAKGKTNAERMKEGKAPLDKDGNPIELHHIGQKADSPLAELTREEHRQGDNYKILHPENKESEIDREEFTKVREGHWQNR